MNAISSPLDDIAVLPDFRKEQSLADMPLDGQGEVSPATFLASNPEYFEFLERMGAKGNRDCIVREGEFPTFGLFAYLKESAVESGRFTGEMQFTGAHQVNVLGGEFAGDYPFSFARDVGIDGGRFTSRTCFYKARGIAVAGGEFDAVHDKQMLFHYASDVRITGGRFKGSLLYMADGITVTGNPEGDLHFFSSRATMHNVLTSPKISLTYGSRHKVYLPGNRIEQIEDLSGGIIIARSIGIVKSRFSKGTVLTASADQGRELCTIIDAEDLKDIAAPDVDGYMAFLQEKYHVR